MEKISKVRSNTCPPQIKITQKFVFVASNITQYTETYEGRQENGYEYTYTIYTKDQYILLMAQQTKAIQELQDQLQAAKILLGVDD